MTWLHHAAITGDLDIVWLLAGTRRGPHCECPADSEMVARFVPHDRTPLGWARYNRQQEVVAYLTDVTSSEP